MEKTNQKKTVNFFLKTEVGKTEGIPSILEFHKKKKKKRKTPSVEITKMGGFDTSTES